MKKRGKKKKEKQKRGEKKETEKKRAHAETLTVDNHGILHIVTSVGNNGDDGIGTQRVVVDVVLDVVFVSHERRLRVLDAEHLVVDAVQERVERRAHRLLTHLALWSGEKGREGGKKSDRTMQGKKR